MEFRSFMPCFHLHQYHRRYIRRRAANSSTLPLAAKKKGAEARPAFGATQSNTKLLLLVVWNRTVLPSDPLPSVPHVSNTKQHKATVPSDPLPSVPHVHAFMPCFHGTIRPSRTHKGFHPLWGMGPQIFKSSSSAPRLSHQVNEPLGLRWLFIIDPAPFIT